MCILGLLYMQKAKQTAYANGKATTSGFSLLIWHSEREKYMENWETHRVDGTTTKKKKKVHSILSRQQHGKTCNRVFRCSKNVRSSFSICVFCLALSHTHITFTSTLVYSHSSASMCVCVCAVQWRCQKSVSRIEKKENENKCQHSYNFSTYHSSNGVFVFMLIFC